MADNVSFNTFQNMVVASLLHFLDRVTGFVSHNKALSVILGSISLIAIVVSSYYLKHDDTPILDVPLVDISVVKKGQIELNGLHGALKSNCAKYRNELWQLKMRHGTIVILPPRYIDELRNLPEDTVSLEMKNEDRFLARYTRLTTTSVGGNHAHPIYCIKHDLTRTIGNLMKEIYEETEYAFSTSIGECDDWKEVPIGNVLTKTVALVSGRIFAGPELNRDPDYLQSIIRFTFIAFMAVEALSRYPVWLRPLAQYWIKEVQGIHWSMNQMKKIMSKIVPERIRLISEGKAPNNLTTWHIKRVPGEQKEDLTIHSHTQLVASMAAVHTTTMLTTHIIFDLLARPEYIEPMRNEMEEALSHEKESYFTKSTMPKLRKLDSFMKETQRVNPLGLLTFERKVVKDITLHDGTILPKGCHFAVPAHFMAMDPERWGNPEEFDGNRFLKLRGGNVLGNGGKYTFIETGIGPHDLIAFGHGSHACPGRFFANNEMKVILTYLLQNYEMKLPDGEGRPANLYSAGGMRPDYSKKILMRRRKPTRAA